MKFLTFSFDDGNEDDVRLVEIMNRYGLKGTFNLNSGSLTNTSSWKYCGEKDVRHLNYFDYPDLYDGHEIAGHSYTHPHLEELDRNTLSNQIRLDKKILEHLYNCKIRGMAYPFGTYNQDVVDLSKNNGMEYSRTVKATHKFALPEEPLTWHPTCHFRDQEIYRLATEFLKSTEKEDLLFYIWGHSYELVTEKDWKAFEEFCFHISDHADICYCTNIEVLDYIAGGKQNEHLGRI